MLKFDSLKDGSCVVVFSTAAEAATCVDKMHGRWYAERQIVADYLPDGTSAKEKLPKLSKAVVLLNVFDPVQAMNQLFVQQLAADFEIECSKYGPIEKLDVSWTEDESVIRIIFVSSLSAADCIVGMNNMMCDGRQLTVKYDPSYLITEDKAKEVEELSVKMERERKLRQQKEDEAKALKEAAKKGGTVAVKEEKKFQAFWRNLNGVDDDDDVGVLSASASAPPASPPRHSP